MSVVESTKLLGLTISNDLTRNVHVSEVRKYLLKQLYFLIQLKRANVSEFDLSRFYIACICSVIDYAAPVFNHALPKYLLNELERIQKRALRFIYPYTEYHHALSRLGLPTIAEHHDHTCQPTFKSIVSDSQHKLRKLLPPEFSTQNNLRCLRTYNLPCCNTNRFKNSFLTLYLPPINQAKIDDFHIFINISAGIYSSVLSYIPFERGIN